MRWIKIVSLLFLFQACGEKTPERPKNVLPMQEMKGLVFELVLANSTINLLVKGPIDSAVYIYDNVYRDSIYDKYGIDHNSFTESYRYYFSDNERLEPLMNAVMDSMNAYEADLRKNMPSTSTDSIPKFSDDFLN